MEISPQPDSCLFSPFHKTARRPSDNSLVARSSENISGPGGRVKRDVGVVATTLRRFWLCQRRPWNLQPAVAEGLLGQPPWRCCLLFCLIFIFSSSLVLAEEYRNQAEGILYLRYLDNRLNLETTDAALDKVLKELSLISGLTIVSNAPITGQLTIRINNYPLDKAMRKILRGKDTSFIYAAPADVPANRYPLKEVRIYQESDDSEEGLKYSYKKAKDDKKKKAKDDKKKKKKYSKKNRAKKAAAARRVREKQAARSFSSQRFADDLMGGDIYDWEELGERLEEQNPGAQEQLDQFMDYFEDAQDKARDNAEKRGHPFTQ